MTTDLAAFVEAALSGRHDFDDAWRRVGDAIAAAPNSRTLRRQRMLLAQAVDMRNEHLADLRVLVQLDPRDRKAALELALREFAWAPADAPGALHSQRLAELLTLLHRLDDKASRLCWALEIWDATRVWEPWTRLLIALHGCACHPGDAALRRHLALSWAMLMQQPPAIEPAEGALPFGFALDAAGNLCDALIGGRALAALRGAIEQWSDDAELVYARALVGQGLSRFVEAEADFATAARAWDRRADRTDLPPGEAALARSCADHAFALAQRASGGRATVARPWLPDSGGGPHTPGTLFSMPTLTGMPAPQRKGAERCAAPLGDSAELDSARRAEWVLQTLEQLAPALVPPLQPWREATAPPTASPPWLPAAELVQAAGLLPLAWVEHPSVTDVQGGLAPCRVWCSRDGAMTLLAVAVGDAAGLELCTEFDNGRQLVTTNARGRTCLGGGEDVDTLHVDATLHLELLLALHRARVALQRALQPGVNVRGVQTLTGFVAMQQRQQAALSAYRLAFGMDEFEALAVPSELPEVFAPMLQAAARAWVRDRA